MPSKKWFDCMVHFMQSVSDLNFKQYGKNCPRPIYGCPRSGQLAPAGRERAIRKSYAQLLTWDFQLSGERSKHSITISYLHVRIMHSPDPTSANAPGLIQTVHVSILVQHCT